MIRQDKPLIDELRSLYAENSAASSLFDEFSNRKRNRRVTKTDWVARRFASSGIRRADIISMFRRLEQLDCGKYVEGRRGNPSRFEWSKSSLAICRLASGETENAEPQELSDVGVDEGEPDTEIEVHTLRLRPDFMIELELPTDLTTREAERVGKFLLSLPRD